MPTYEYECRSCLRRFDRVQSFHDEPVRVCPYCGGETRRVLQPVGVIFKGSGWYSTDSRKSGSGTANQASAEDKGASGEKAASSESAASGESAKDGAAKDGSVKDNSAKDSGAKDNSAKPAAKETKGAGE